MSLVAVTICVDVQRKQASEEKAGVSQSSDYSQRHLNEKTTESEGLNTPPIWPTWSETPSSRHPTPTWKPIPPWHLRHPAPTSTM